MLIDTAVKIIFKECEEPIDAIFFFHKTSMKTMETRKFCIKITFFLCQSCIVFHHSVPVICDAFFSSFASLKTCWS